MKKGQIILAIAVIILVAGGIFFLQNRSPVIAVVIFGSQTVALPIGIWLILSAIAGVITSLFLQFLLGVFSKKARRPRDWNDDQEEDFQFPDNEDDQPENFTAQNFSQPQTNVQSERSEPINDRVGSAFNNSEEDWEFSPQREDWNDIDEEWNIEEPPRQNNTSKTARDYNFYETEEEREKRFEQRSVESNRTRSDRNLNSGLNEVSFRSEEVSPERSNEAEEAEENSPQIYEANYRVIRPPLWNLPQDDNEEDDEPDQR